MNQKVENLKGKLIVSCQALPDEPLHSSFIMGRMALAAKQGGASGIRANTKEDIKEIQSQVDLPIIGIVKRDYEDSDIYITPTMKEIEELMEELKKKYTVVVVTHNMQQAARVSDYTAFFLVGEVVEFDTTDNIFSRPKDKRTEDYITGRFG